MKLLKIVLIALVTVGIYSFTHIPKEKTTTKNFLISTDVLLVYPEGTSKSERRLMRDCLIRQIKHKYLSIGTIENCSENPNAEIVEFLNLIIYPTNGSSISDPDENESNFLQNVKEMSGQEFGAAATGCGIRLATPFIDCQSLNNFISID